MFGVPVSLRVPEVIGVRLRNRLSGGVLATDLALTVTDLLRKRGMSGKFVEFFGPGVATLTSGERAVVANMAPEYGASTGYFPIDDHTLAYLRATGRTEAHISLVQAYAQANALWFDPAAEPLYTDVLDIDLATLRPTIAGPRRPQDGLNPADILTVLAKDGVSSHAIPDGAIAIAAITSCTNTTDFGLLVTAGLLARKARALDLTPAPWVKTSLAPGSPAAAARLRQAGLLGDLEALGFGVAAYGCTTCIGNSGPLLPMMATALEQSAFKPVAILSGNRNFPGRVHAQIEQAFLASPPLVIAYALAGHARLDITHDIIGIASSGQSVRLSDIWPEASEIEAAISAGTDARSIASAYAEAEASPLWAALSAPTGARYPWDPTSTYIRRPPFVSSAGALDQIGLLEAHPLLVLGDDITTDHISPAGAIPAKSDAGTWLIERGENPHDLNVYASRRGNWEVMLRGLFTNRTVVNHMAPDAGPGRAIFAPTGNTLPVWQAAERYKAAGVPVVIIAGERYGTGSSRDWAAKGAQLLGVRTVLANSFERIHRANLVCMGIVPLQMPTDWRPAQLGLIPGDTVKIDFQSQILTPRCEARLTIWRDGNCIRSGIATALLDTTREVSLILAGGIIPMILNRAPRRCQTAAMSLAAPSS